MFINFHLGFHRNCAKICNSKVTQNASSGEEVGTLPYSYIDKYENEATILSYEPVPNWKFKKSLSII